MTTSRPNSENEKDQQVIEVSKFPLPDLLEEIRTSNVIPNFSPNELGLFAQTSHDADKETAFLRLLPCAIDAKPTHFIPNLNRKLAAIAILIRHPDLLFKRGIVQDHFGRIIEASAYQLFLGAGDIWALKEIHERILPKIHDGEAHAKAQFQEQFPYCLGRFDPILGEEQLYDDRNIQQIKQVIAQLKIVIKKLRADPCTELGQVTIDETAAAVNDLCQIFAPKQGEIIRTGLHFPLAILNSLHMAYDDKIYILGAHRPNQATFYSRAVIGSAEAALSAVDGQCWKQGLRYEFYENGPNRGDGLFCKQPIGTPAHWAPIRGKLGHTMFVDPEEGTSCFICQENNEFAWIPKHGYRILPRYDGQMSSGKSLYINKLWCAKSATYQQLYSSDMQPTNTATPVA